MSSGRKTRGSSDKSYKGFNSASEDRLREVRLLQKTPAGAFGRVAAPSVESLRKFIKAQTCPWCGRGPYKSLANHTNNAHGVSADELREMAGFVKDQPICSEDLSHHRAGIRRGQRLPDVAYDRNKKSRRRYSEAGLAVQRAKLDSGRSPEQVRRAGQAAAEAVMAANEDKYRRVVDLFNQGLLIKDIATEVGVSIPLVRGALERAGLADDLLRRRWELKSDAELAEFRARGKEAARKAAESRTAEMLARFAELGGDRRAVRQMAGERGVSLRSLTDSLRRRGAHVPDGRADARPSKYSAELVAEISRLYEQGLSQKQVGAQVDLSQNAVSRILRRAGVTTRPFERRGRATP